ncbi:MAG: DUF3347 domain-containing protein [Calditrichaeota bacterium]|nr:efflux RND transporter periplasmic adaptor subunit [Calditrichota bacterium]RQW04730.1 MAG: DUF3347 domain-containing protein [Calditrichota bacterium]
MNKIFQDIISKHRKSFIFWIVTLMIAFLLGWWFSNDGNGTTHSHPASPESTGGETTVWTCSMHPQIQQPKPGKCPICGMDLIPLRQESGSENPRQLKLSETARKLAQVETVPVRRQYVSREIRLVGKIEYDETRLKYITAWVPGRIDRLYVNYSGISVRKGDHLVELYSPELLSTQQELVTSLKTLEKMSGMSGLLESTEIQVQATRERLRLWGLTDAQISSLEKNRNPSDHITIYSPGSGIVIEKNALEGSYVETGTRIYTIADISTVWVKMDAYESDLSWLHYGQEVEFSTEAYPGEVFKGRLSFIDPILNPETRTVKIRANLENPQNKLKPAMFVRAMVHSSLAAGGKVMDPDLAGKWISPMHPEVVKDHPGSCDVCGMPLVRAEELGYVSVEDMQKQAPLVIPASAPLITGKRAIVYVELPGQKGIYQGREITLGPRAGDYYIVEDGLQEGELVVVRGNFKIDSAIQIKAGQSMMYPEEKVPSAGHENGEMNSSVEQIKPERFRDISEDFLKQLDRLYSDYFDMQYALSHDTLALAISAAGNLENHLRQVETNLLEGKAKDKWKHRKLHLEKVTKQIKKSETIEDARNAFEDLSNSLIEIAHNFGSARQRLLVYHCPMAFDFMGADWLQNKEGTENPYFGSTMFTCGDQTADLSQENIIEEHEGHQK